MSKADPFTQEQIRDFVIPCHGDLARVQEMLAAAPDLVRTRYEAWQESPLGAAAHVGNVPIAEFLLRNGAPMEICAAAMLGRRDEVLAWIDRDPTQANARGAHGIPLIHHVALSGDVALAQAIVQRGGGEGIATALHAAVSKGHMEMARWLLERGATKTQEDFRGKTPLQVAEERGDEALAALLREA